MARNKAKIKIEGKTSLSLDEALENLATLAQMESDEKTTIGLLKGEKLVVEGEEHPYTDVIWLFPEDHLNFIASVRPSFAALLEHLEKMWSKHQIDPDNSKVKKGVESIFSLAIDAAEKVQSYFALFGKEVDLTKTEEFIHLEDFWNSRIKPALGSEAEQWEKNWAKNPENAALDFDFTGLKDWETIKEDRSWELLHLKDENENPLFDTQLLKSIKISATLDAAKRTKEDFILFLEKEKNSDLQLSSRHMLKLLEKEVEKFYKSRFNFAKNRLAAVVSKAFLALFLTANPRNLVKKTKKCLRYFHDFHSFLRRCLQTSEYRQALFSRKSNLLFSYVNELCYQLFTRVITIKEEMIGYLHRLKRQGSRGEKFKNANLLTKIGLFDEDIRLFLKKMPSGPVFKLLQALRKDRWGFDPLLENSAPAKLYSFEIRNKRCSVLHLPSPTSQKTVSKAAVANEFIGFLEGLKAHDEKLLFVNLQDRISYKEGARAKVIEEVSLREEFKKVLTVVGLNKDSSFYHQSEGYARLEKAEDFIEVFQEKLFSQNKDDFFVSERIDSDRKAFCSALIQKIHELFFLEKPSLAQNERTDFIELFYHFFILKLIEEKKPNFIAFSSKDGVDSAAALNGSFLVFLKQLSKSKWQSHEEDFLSFLFFSPALLTRHRSIDPIALNRSLACLSHLEEREKELKKTFAALYDKHLFDDIRIIY